jgi:hypothetical protein
MTPGTGDAADQAKVGPGRQQGSRPARMPFSAGTFLADPQIPGTVARGRAGVARNGASSLICSALDVGATYRDGQRPAGGAAC